MKYEVQNTCPIDTSLQMVYFLWFRRFVTHSVVEKDSLLLEILNHVRKDNFAKAHHDLLIGRSLPIKVEKEGNTKRWNCWGEIMEYKPFPVLFRAPGNMQLIWGNFSKMGGNSPLHDFFQKNQQIGEWESYINTNPIVTIQETIYNCHGMDLSPCQKENDNYCPENGMRQRHAVSSFSSCPWVMTIRGYLNFDTFDNIPNKCSFPQTPNTLLQVSFYVMVTF